MNQTVLIVADEVDFPRSVTQRWQAERHPPSFTLVTSDLCNDVERGSFDLAIVGGVAKEHLSQLLKSLRSGGKPVLLAQAPGEERPQAYDGLLICPTRGAWVDSLVVLASECLKRCETTARVRHLEQANATLEKQASLGRYVLDERHALNNALTSVLGNSELMLMEPELLSSGVRAQTETIRNMALRIHEIMQRFSSLEKEFNLVERQAGQDAERRALAAGMN